jgi:two-component system nitrate/nitrite response regulator NarL
MAIPPRKLIRILLVDHHTLVRAGIRMLIETQAGLTVVGEAGDAAEALLIAAREHPDIILFDPNLNDCESLDLIPQLLAAAGRAQVLLVTSISDPRMHEQAIELGAMGVVLEQQPVEVLFKAIEKVYTGEAWFDRSMIARVLAKLSRARAAGNTDVESDKIALLSQREREVIALIGQGLKNKQIAERLSISEITARHHMTSIFSKLGISDRLELIVFAYRHGLAQLPR